MHKDLFISNDVFVFNWSKDSDFVEGILDLFLWEVGELDFFEGVDLVVFLTLYFVNSWVCALTWNRVWDVPSLFIIEKSLSDIKNYNKLYDEYDICFNFNIYLLKFF